MRTIRLRGSPITTSDRLRLERSEKFELKSYNPDKNRKLTGLESLAQYETGLTEKDDYVQAFELQTTRDQETRESFEDIIVVRPSTTPMASMISIITQHHALHAKSDYQPPSILFDGDDSCDSAKFGQASLMVSAMSDMGLRVYKSVDDLLDGL